MSRNNKIVATRISRARTGLDAWVYRLSATVMFESRGQRVETQFVVITTMRADGREQTLIYPSDEQGDVLSYNELPGSYSGGTDQDKAIQDAGWTLDPKSVKRPAPSEREAREVARSAPVDARDYIAVDVHGHKVWGPGKDYAEAKRQADRAGGVVKFEMGEDAFSGASGDIRWDFDGHIYKGFSKANQYLIVATGPTFAVYLVKVDTFGGVHEDMIGEAKSQAEAVKIAERHDSGVGARVVPVDVHVMEDFPTQAAAVEHAYRQRDGEKMFVYYEAGKFHLASPGNEPVNATPISNFRRPGEFGFAEAREDAAPVIYEAGAQRPGGEQPGQPWPSPESLSKRKRGGREEAPPTAPLASEASAKQQGDCLPWVRVTRDPERYEACLAEARKIGPIDNPRKIYDLLAPTLAKEDQEVLMVVLVDVRRQLRGVAEVHRGQRSRVGVGVIDVMRIVIATGAEGFACVHNHPSGNAKPSDADVDLTKTIEEAAKPYGKDVTFLDHVVIGSGQFYSIREGKLYKV